MIHSKTKNKFQTKLYDDYQFTGEYFDEFIIPSLMHPSEEQNILILGGGLGACLGPLLNTNIVNSVTLIESNRVLCNKASLRHRINNKIKFINNEASRFLKSNTEQFDIVWVDLFDTQGFSEKLKDNKFWNLVFKALRPNGNIAVNVWGLPSFFINHWHKNGVLLFFEQEMQRRGYNYTVFPYRRNLTIVGSNTFEYKDRHFQSHFLKAYQKRIRFPLRINQSFSQSDQTLFSFKEIDKIFWQEYEKWLGYLPDQMQINFRQGINLADAEFVTDCFVRSLEVRSDHWTFLPVIQAASIANGNTLQPYFTNLISNNLELIKKQKMELIYNYLVPQLYSINFSIKSPEINSLINKL